VRGFATKGGFSLIFGPIYVLKGLYFLYAHRSLWKLAAAPVVIGALLLGGGQYLLYRFLAGRLAGWVSQGALYPVLYHAAFAALVMVMVACFLFLFSGMAVVVSGPFNEALSERTESEIRRGVIAPAPFLKLVKETARSFGHGVKLLCLYGGSLLAGCALFLVPVFGPLLFGFFSLALSSYMAAYQFMDHPMSRRGYTFREKTAFLRRRLVASLGFGIGVVFPASFPLINVLVIPAAAVGGTLLFLDLEAECSALSRGESLECG
jgi:CysZ protein